MSLEKSRKRKRRQTKKEHKKYLQNFLKKPQPPLWKIAYQHEGSNPNILNLLVFNIIIEGNI